MDCDPNCRTRNAWTLAAILLAGVCLEHNADLHAAENLEVNRISRRSLISDMKVAFVCKDVPIWEFGKMLTQERDKKAFPLLFPAYRKFSATGVSDLSERLERHTVTLDLHDTAYWDAVAQVATATNHGIRMYQGLPSLDTSVSPPRNWAVVGPMLAIVEFVSDDVDGAQTSGQRVEARLRFSYIPGEAHFADMRIDAPAIVMRDGKKLAIQADQDAAGVWRYPLPRGVDPAAVVAVEGNVLAKVASEIVVIALRPEGAASDKSLQIRATSSAIQESKKLVTDNSTWEPPRGYDKVFYSVVDVQWKLESTAAELGRVRPMLLASMNDRDIAIAKSLLEEDVILEWVDTRRSGVGAENRVTKPNTALNFKVPGRMTIHLFSHRRSDLEECNEIVLARQRILHQDVKIDIKR